LSSAARRVGLLGGAFDPPHQAHVALAQAALDQLRLDELRIVPTGQAWHKSRPLTAAIHRLAMARLAFAGLPRVVIDERELSRSGPTYTIDTLQALRLEQPGAEFYLVIGGDQWAAFTTWKRWQDVAHQAHLCVVDRPGLAQGGPDGVPVRHLHLGPMAISATALREHLARGRPLAEVSDQVPAAVARYISDHRLYVPG
jgi:nicotinate-nucleotide adenylyltransferase